mmetsp:Transcript_878/g.2792  ORF Transcript_878/g.2792 Transcript_878/m.2792 type:complete len:102 (+) Transcript_878:99-404(+)
MVYSPQACKSGNRLLLVCAFALMVIRLLLGCFLEQTTSGSELAATEELLSCAYLTALLVVVDRGMVFVASKRSGSADEVVEDAVAADSALKWTYLMLPLSM